MDKLGLWVVATAVLIAAVYGPLFWDLFHHYVAVPSVQVS